jgi:predicted lipid-binding transport protein (Tim44 family)
MIRRLLRPGRGRRAIVALAIVILAVLIITPVALAAAGGGSSGFSGGGDGGGGGGGGGGHGAGLYIIIQLFIRLLLFTHGVTRIIVIALIVGAVLYFYLAPRLRNYWQGQRNSGQASRRQVARRQRRVELAAAEASDEDPAYAPDIVRPAAAKLFTDVQAAWDAADRIHLRGLVASDLLAEWERRLDDFERRGWRNRAQLLEEPKVHYVGLARRGRDREDRVVVRIEARLRDYVEDAQGRHIKRSDRITETVRVREYWTLGLRDGHWILVSIEQGAEGAHALREDVIATPWADESGLRDEALIEGAVASSVPAGTSISEVADLDFAGDGRAAALDLSLADGRFAPDVLEVAARRAVSAWAEAVDGDDGALLAISHLDAARELLHRGDSSARTRLVVRGLEVRHISIDSLDAAAGPPTMTIDVELKGRRYLEDRDTAAVVAGSKARAVTFTERWTLALDGPAEEPWRIAAVGTPAGRSQ